MSKNSLGRNERCWCGSGRKYKKCHLNRSEEEPVPAWSAAKAMRKKFSRELCLAPKSMHDECSGKIVKAHTIPKSSSLKAIGQHGHVLGLKMSHESMTKFGGRLEPEKIGIKNASTFMGFCQKHDDKLFSCLEKYIFTATEEQCFKLAFRSFAKEYYAKAALVDMHQIHSELDRGKSLNRQLEIQEHSFLANVGAQMGLKDNEFHKKIFDRCAENNKYDDIRAVVLVFDELFPAQVCGSVNPDFDFNNNKIQDMSDVNLVPDLLSLTSFYDGEKSVIVLSWLEYCHKSCETLVESLLQKPPEIISTYLLQYIFSNFENFFLSPVWWDGLIAKDKDSIVEISQDNVSMFVGPHGESISKIILNALLPRPVSISRVNW